MQKYVYILIYCVASGLVHTSCASYRSILGVNDSEKLKPIANPFSGYKAGSTKTDSARNMILRTKKGDRSVEVEIPGDTENLSEFVLPVAPAFKESNRTLASTDSASGGGIDESYKNHQASLSDHEIIRNFPHSLAEDDGKRREIEKELNLTASEDDMLADGNSSYLASMDHIKQLYKMSRYEAALIETDEMIKLYQTDPKLYEMKGTLLDHLGRRELAMRSWNQALRFDPNNEGLRRFVNRKLARAPAGSP